MGMTIAMDASGCIVIPKALRDEAGLRADVPLHIGVRDGRIEIEPAARPIRRVKRGRVMFAVAADSASEEELSADVVDRTMRGLRKRDR